MFMSQNETNVQANTTEYCNCVTIIEEPVINTEEPTQPKSTKVYAPSDLLGGGIFNSYGLDFTAIR
jgi:delta 1-pyrroline-5-carboxylate dehydrogenase